MDHAYEYPSHWQAILSISAKIGCSGHSLNECVKTAEVNAGKRVGVSTDMAAKLKALERENPPIQQGRLTL